MFKCIKPHYKNILEYGLNIGLNVYFHNLKLIHFIKIQYIETPIY